MPRKKVDKLTQPPKIARPTLAQVLADEQFYTRKTTGYQDQKAALNTVRDVVRKRLKTLENKYAKDPNFYSAAYESAIKEGEELLNKLKVYRDSKLSPALQAQNKEATVAGLKAGLAWLNNKTSTVKGSKVAMRRGANISELSDNRGKVRADVVATDISSLNRVQYREIWRLVDLWAENSEMNRMRGENYRYHLYNDIMRYNGMGGINKTQTFAIQRRRIVRELLKDLGAADMNDIDAHRALTQAAADKLIAVDHEEYEDLKRRGKAPDDSVFIEITPEEDLIPWWPGNA